MSIDLQKRVNNYIDATPGMKIVPYNVVLQNMLTENKLTRAEYDELMNISVFGFLAFDTETDFNSIMGLKLSNAVPKPEVSKKEKSVKTLSPEEIQDVLQKEQDSIAKLKEIFADLGIEFNDDLSYKPQRFDLNFIKSIYDESKYEIVDRSNSIVVKPKTDEDTLEHIVFFKDGTRISKYDSNGDEEIGFYSWERDEKGNNKITSVFSKEYRFVYNSGKLIDASIDDTSIEVNENREIVSVEYRDSNYNVLSRQYPVVDEMIKLKDAPEKLCKLIKEKVDYNNIGAVLFEFKDKTGIDLLADYFSQKDTANLEISNLLMQEILTPDCFPFPDEYETKKKAELFSNYIELALESKDKDIIYQAFRLVDNTTVYDLINIYRNEKESEDIKVPMLPITTLIQELQLKGYEDIVYDKIVPCLQKAYLYESDPELAEFMLKEMPKLLEAQIKKGAYIDDIVSDMERNEGNIKNQLIDFKRAMTRNKPLHNTSVTKPNGRFDDSVEQGMIGDCWLLAGLMSIYKKENGREYLESLVQANVSGDTVTVTLPGVNKQYEISWGEIQANGHLVKGDGDIRAIEIAIDKYIKEQAYGDEYSFNVDIHGNNLSFLYDVLIGPNDEKEDCVTASVYGKSRSSNAFTSKDAEKFNDPNSFYSIGFHSMFLEPEDLVGAAISVETGKRVDLYASHAYATLKSDEKYVYLINPWDSEETLKVEIEKLVALGAEYGGRNFDMHSLEGMNRNFLYKKEEEKRGFF